MFIFIMRYRTLRYWESDDHNRHAVLIPVKPKALVDDDQGANIKRKGRHVGLDGCYSKERTILGNLVRFLVNNTSCIKAG
ncbi:hypothetical protein EBB79_11705 [Parasedimentitalea marina]|uniref:Uncharacterized protein n=1 Tax=Parasedimentitalea marina TaxID=2483033 RepID=A0A3T0N360_9RHOB|nr:hypothetical protein EBB79_11705 [Parasedimentitalea marina]